MHIDTSLLREKFEIKEKKGKDDDTALVIMACSNRMLINLQAGELPTETFIVRTNSMHTCTRMASLIIANYEKMGPITPRLERIEWPDIWDKALSDYERRYNTDRWLAIYYKGKPIFYYGKYHPFLDIIEQCDYVNKEDYNKSLEFAETVFKKAGKNVTIDYDSNIALVAIIGRDSGRCSMILRAPDRTTTFNYSLKPLNSGEKINIAQSLSSAGDFLEGAQLAYLVGINSEKLNLGMLEKFSDEARQANKARKRIYQIESQINSMENSHILRYRPERPLFEFMIMQAEKYAKDNLRL